MHTKPEIDSTLSAKPVIITYYNKTKGGVDNMDKLLGEYSTKRKTCRWPLALFFNAIDVAALAAYIIYIEQNTQLTSTDRRRRFLKELSFQLCKENIEQRAQNPKIIAKPFTRSAIEEVFGKRINQGGINGFTNTANRDKTGRISVVGSCSICAVSNKKRKTRKACAGCSTPICNEHSINRPLCETCFSETQ